MEFDEKAQKVLTSQVVLRKELKIYQEDTFGEPYLSCMRYIDSDLCAALVPAEGGGRRKGKNAKPDWDEIDRMKGDVSSLIDRSRLPDHPAFVFRMGPRMSDEDLYLLAAHICAGEAGLIAEARRFRWKGQEECPVIKNGVNVVIGSETKKQE